MSSAPALYIARHAETVFNRAARMQGPDAHTPLTHRGIDQAHAMGRRLRALIGAGPKIDVWTSTAGRTRQTAAIICEHLELDYFTARADERLQEIDVGDWVGRSYADIEAEIGPFVDWQRRVFTVAPPGGETYPQVAARLADWLGERRAAEERDRPLLVITHGMSARLLRGLILGGDGDPPMPADAPQGTLFHVADGGEQILTPEDAGQAASPA